MESPVRKPFREELRVLRHVAAAKDPVVVSALETLEATDVPDVGIEPFADLASWLTTSVAPRVTSVALVPDQDAGVLSHLASHFLSSFRFQRHGLVAGSDVLSVLARAEYHMNEKDLDSAARELNQLQGTAKVLLADWLDAARRRLEVLQALEVRIVISHPPRALIQPILSAGCSISGNCCFFTSRLAHYTVYIINNTRIQLGLRTGRIKFHRCVYWYQFPPFSRVRSVAGCWLAADADAKAHSQITWALLTTVCILSDP